MKDAQALFREGVMALREARDVPRARQLLTQSLKLDPNNEMAWLWLSRTTDDPARQLQCVERALKLNPDNAQAKALHEKLLARAAPPPPRTPAFYDDSPPIQRTSAFLDETTPPPSSPADPKPLPQRRAAVFFDVEAAAQIEPEPEPESVHERLPEADPGVKTQRDKLTADEQRQIDRHLADAEAKLGADDPEGAVEAWLNALHIQVDHPQAIQRIVRQLYRMNYIEDAQELLQRAIDAGTPSVAIYLTAIDVNKRLGNFARTEALREQVILLDTADDAVILKVIDSLMSDMQPDKAIALLEKALARRPSHDLYMKLGAIYEEQGRKPLATSMYEKAARLGRGRGRRSADQAVAAFTPVITDAERGSIPLALREAAGFGVGWLLLAWQDAGLNLARLTPAHWGGVGLALLGGYLVITATSSPQQRGIAALFGGRVPEKPEGGSFTRDVRVNAWEDAAHNLPPGAMQDPTSLPILPGWARGLLFLLGVGILGFAFYLVFARSIALLLNPVPPPLPSIFDFIVIE